MQQLHRVGDPVGTARYIIISVIIVIIVVIIIIIMIVIVIVMVNTIDL